MMNETFKLKASSSNFFHEPCQEFMDCGDVGHGATNFKFRKPLKSIGGQLCLNLWPPCCFLKSNYTSTSIFLLIKEYFCIFGEEK